VVDVNLKGKEHIQSITICIVGSVNQPGLSYNTRSTFMEISNVVWSDGDEGPLQGKHTFPFAMTLPNEVVSSIKGFDQPFALPPSFNEPDIRTNVKYEIVARIRRGLMRAPSKIGTDFVYIPVKQPPPASILRQRAYRNWSPLVGVEGDPDGWHTAELVVMKGSLFGARHVEVRCTVRRIAYQSGVCC